MNIPHTGYPGSDKRGRVREIAVNSAKQSLAAYVASIKHLIVLCGAIGLLAVCYTRIGVHQGLCIVKHVLSLLVVRVLIPILETGIAYHEKRKANTGESEPSEASGNKT